LLAVALYTTDIADRKTVGGKLRDIGKGKEKGENRRKPDLYRSEGMILDGFFFYIFK